MLIWQADFYKRSLFNEQGESLWELLICNSLGQIIYEAKCPQSQANQDWLMIQLQKATANGSPNLLQVFRPQSVNLLTLCAEKLGIAVVATRRTKALKDILQKRATEPIHQDSLDRPPPQALPENIWGEQWQFVNVKSGDLIEFFSNRPMPIFKAPDELLPINLGLASTFAIPGIVIYGGKKSMYLARWIEEEKPVAINYIPTAVGQSGGLVLESGLINRWILATFEDSEVAVAAENYEHRKLKSRGLHFLIVQPDSSGMAHTGFWLLQDD